MTEPTTDENTTRVSRERLFEVAAPMAVTRHGEPYAWSAYHGDDEPGPSGYDPYALAALRDEYGTELHAYLPDPDGAEVIELAATYKDDAADASFTRYASPEGDGTPHGPGEPVPFDEAAATVARWGQEWAAREAAEKARETALSEAAARFGVTAENWRVDEPYPYPDDDPSDGVAELRTRRFSDGTSLTTYRRFSDDGWEWAAYDGRETVASGTADDADAAKAAAVEAKTGLYQQGVTPAAGFPKTEPSDGDDIMF